MFNENLGTKTIDEQRQGEAYFNEELNKVRDEVEDFSGSIKRKP